MTIFKNSYQCIAYTDDATLLSGTREELKDLLRKLDEAAGKFGMKIKESKKTKYLLYICRLGGVSREKI